MGYYRQSTFGGTPRWALSKDDPRLKEPEPMEHYYFEFETRATDMSVESAIKELEHLGSDQDPIHHRGEHTEPRDLLCNYAFERAATTRISYFGGPPGKCRWIRGGTLSAMVENRRRLLAE